MKFVGQNVPYTWICFFLFVLFFCACVCMITGPNHCDHMTKIEQGTLCIIISVLDILQLRLKVYNAYCLKIRLFIELSELQFSGTEKIIGWSEAEKGCVLLFTIKTPRQALILQRILVIPGQVLQRELDNSGMCSNRNIARLLSLF